MKKYNEPEFNIIKVNVTDVICTSGSVSPVSNISETDNAYLAIGRLFGGSDGFFIGI